MITIPQADAIAKFDLRPPIVAQQLDYTNTTAPAVITNNVGLCLRYEIIQLSEESYGRFIVTLEAPARPNENFRRAIRRHPL